MNNCCPDFEKAQESGTDNEGYGRLAHENSDGWKIGSSDLPRINFCPWCGHDKRKETWQDRASKLLVMRMKTIRESRDEIITAFIAKHQCEPDDCIQVVQSLSGGEAFIVRKMTPQEKTALYADSSHVPNEP